MTPHPTTPIARRTAYIAGAALAVGLTVTMLEAGQPVARTANPFGTGDPVADTMLQDQRGGLRINGLNFNLAVEIRTLVRGALEMVTNVKVADNGGWAGGNSTSWVFGSGGPPGLTGSAQPSPQASAPQAAASAPSASSPPSTAPTAGAAAVSSTPSTGGTPRTGATPSTGGTQSAPPPAPVAKAPLTSTSETGVAVTAAPSNSTASSQPAATETQQDATTPTVSRKTFASNELNSEDGISAAVGDPTTTEVIHQISRGGIATVVKNRKDRQVIESMTQLNVNFRNHAEFSRKMRSRIRLNRIVQELTNGQF